MFWTVPPVVVIYIVFIFDMLINTFLHLLTLRFMIFHTVFFLYVERNKRWLSVDFDKVCRSIFINKNRYGLTEPTKMRPDDRPAPFLILCPCNTADMLNCRCRNNDTNCRWELLPSKRIHDGLPSYNAI